MGQHFTLGAGPVQIMGQHVLSRLYGCRRLWYDFLLVINTNLPHILHRFQVMAD